MEARIEKTLPLVRVQSSAEVNTLAVLRLEPEPIWLPLMKRTKELSLQEDVTVRDI